MKNQAVDSRLADNRVQIADAQLSLSSLECLNRSHIASYSSKTAIFGSAARPNNTRVRLVTPPSFQRSTKEIISKRGRRQCETEKLNAAIKCNGKRRRHQSSNRPSRDETLWESEVDDLDDLAGIRGPGCTLLVSASYITPRHVITNDQRTGRVKLLMAV